MPFVTINGQLHHYDLRGPAEASAIVFINSLGTDFRIWDQVIRHLPPGLRILTFDKRGHGLSGPAVGPLTIRDYAEDLAGLMDHLGVGSATIVGLSIGGMIALSLSEIRPDLVANLMLADTAHRIGTADAWQSRIDAVRANGIVSIADAVMERWFSPDYRAHSADYVEGWRTMLTRTSVDGYVTACAAIRDADFEPAARRLTVPTICVVGSTDGSTPPPLVRELADLIPRATFRQIDGPAHLPNLECPELFADILKGFMGANGGGAATDRFAIGMAVRRAVLGNAHVDRAEAAKTAFDRDFQDFIVEGAWGSLWSRPGLTRRERSLITLALLAALGHGEEVAMHARATRNTGASPDDIKEALLHVAVYAGVPAANSAFRIIKETLAKEAAAGEKNS